MTIEITEIDVAKLYAMVAQGVGEVSMAFSRLDELLLNLLIILTNPDKREYGHLLYDSQHSHRAKVQLLRELLRAKYGLLGGLLKLAKKNKNLPKDYEVLDRLLVSAINIAEKRNRVIHDVYQCWIGKNGPRFDRRTLRRGHDNLVVVQENMICPVTYNDLHSLANNIMVLRSSIEKNISMNKSLLTGSSVSKL